MPALATFLARPVRAPLAGAALAVIALATFAGCGSTSGPIEFEGPRRTTPPASPRETFRAETMPIGSGSPATMASVGTGEPGVTTSTGGSASPVTTQPPTSGPPADDAATPAVTTTTTTPPSTDGGTATVVGMPPADPGITGLVFPFDSLTEVPQLDEDPVRGSGCGLNESIGDAVQDGFWFGAMSASADGALNLDIVCVYYGDLAISMGAGVSHSAFFPVNESDRTRRIPVAEDFSFREGTSNGFVCRDPGPSFGRPLSSVSRGTIGWVMVEGGRAKLAVSLC